MRVVTHFVAIVVVARLGLCRILLHTDLMGRNPGAQCDEAAPTSRS